jgi:excisionase family DNA binding protein
MTDTATDSWNVTLSAAAEQIGVHKTTLKGWADKGEITCLRLPSGERRFRQSDIDAWIALRRS